MTKFTEILHKIAADVLSDKSGARYDFNMCITDNLQKSEEDFLKRYGTGKSYHFPVDNYEQGQQLAIAIYQGLSGKKADVPATQDDKKNEEGLYLFIYLSPAKVIA